MGTIPCASCTACSFAWHGEAMAHGLRIIGRCPRCGGELVFAAESPAPGPAPDPALTDVRAPHTVLGIPRR